MSKPNILVIEDDVDIQQLVTYNLIKAGMNVTCADDGEEAYTILEEDSVDGILLDLMLPGQDGLEICQSIRKNDKTKHIPIIFVSANNGEKAQIFKGYDAGAVDYLSKPLEPAVLLGKVRVFVEMYKQRKSLEGMGETLTQTDLVPSEDEAWCLAETGIGSHIGSQTGRRFPDHQGIPSSHHQD